MDRVEKIQNSHVPVSLWKEISLDQLVNLYIFRIAKKKRKTSDFFPVKVSTNTVFLCPTDIGISVDSVIVDLTRNIEAEIEDDMREIEKGMTSQNQSVHFQSFFNNTTQLNEITGSHVQPDGGKVDATQGYATPRTMNGTNVNMNNTQSMNGTHDPMDYSQILCSNISMNNTQHLNGSKVQNSENTDHSEAQMNNTENMNGSNVQTNHSSHGQILNESSHHKNQSLSKSLSHLHNESSQLASEVSSIVSAAEDLSFGKESDDSKPYQDVLSESFLYYSGSDGTNKENDLNQSNHGPTAPLIKDGKILCQP